MLTHLHSRWFICFPKLRFSDQRKTPQWQTGLCPNNKKAVNLLILVGFTAFLVDLAGIEPASESLFIKASPITVAVLTFPWMYAHRQAYNLSSFMIHLPGQSLPGKVSHIVGARFLMCECVRADEQHLGC